MDQLFGPGSLNSLPWNPMAWWQANFQLLSNVQQAWMQMVMPGKGSGKEFPMTLPGWNARWFAPEPFMAALMPFMPRIEATITPLKREGKLANAEEASRVTMRMTVPGVGKQNDSEILLVDAVVARATGENSLRLANGDHMERLEAPGGEGKKP